MKLMSVNKNRQTGAVTIWWLVLSVAFGFFIMTSFKVAPAFVEHLAVTSSMKALSTDAGLRGASVHELRDALTRRWEINDVESVQPEYVTINRVGDVYVVNVKYQVQEHYVHNISLLISFDDTVEVPVH